MSSKRAREHAGLVLALKAYKRCYRANGPGISGPRWRAYRTEREKEIMNKKAQQSLKTEPLGLLQFVEAPFEQSRYKDISRGERELWKD